ncbi:hypothetical protein BKI52_28915 [marine bacterium AO1-C]|nr:hypothetical protein BKI52_28915 [marine bacterium AO1-C]
MKITPIEIKKKDFAKQKGFMKKGYDKEEVSRFLEFLAEHWEKILDENKESSIKIQYLEKEISTSRENEDALFKTLKTAEEAGANLVDQARRSAELKVQEAQIKSDVIIKEAQNQARTIVQKANARARNVLDEMLEELRDRERDYKALETYRDNLLLEIRTYINESLEKIDRLESKTSSDYFKEKIAEAQQILEEKQELLDLEKAKVLQDDDVTEDTEVEANVSENGSTEEESFFDKIG